MLWACDGAVPTPDLGGLVLKAAGERIVAFARPGKPPGNSFFKANHRPAVQPNVVILAIRNGF
jgi:hypothetical protein